MRILYFDCAHDIGADVLTAALIDLGVPIPTVFRALDIPDLGLKVNVFKTQEECGAATKFEIVNGIDNENSGDMRRIVENSKLKPEINSRAQKMISLLEETGGAPHSDEWQRGRGLVNSVAYCIAAAVCVDYLSPDKVIFSLPLAGCSPDGYREGAMTDGAAAAAVLGDEFGAVMPSGRITCQGRGVGGSEEEHKRLLRAYIINTGEEV